MVLMPSTDTTVEKAQQLPHFPWSFTLVTAPFCRQSMDYGRPATFTPAYMNPRMAGAIGPSRAEVFDAGFGEGGVELIAVHVAKAVEAEAVGAFAAFVVGVD
jgi:hypothetical protein